MTEELERCLRASLQIEFHDEKEPKKTYSANNASSASLNSGATRLTKNCKTVFPVRHHSCKLLLKPSHLASASRKGNRNKLNGAESSATR
ncbi:MAG: hypothetical protein R3C59_27400 [Planctomycetaceae bacterium]